MSDKIRILVVDDDANPHDTAKKFLNPDYDTDHAEGAYAYDNALIKIFDESKKYNLIITDYHLGSAGDAFQLIQELRDGGIEWPIIVWSADSSNETIMNAQDNVKFISKPPEKSTLLNLINKMLNPSE